MVNAKLLFLAAAALLGTGLCYSTYSGAFGNGSSKSGCCSMGSFSQVATSCCSEKGEAAVSNQGCEGCTGDCCSDCEPGACCGGTGCDCCSADGCTSCASGEKSKEVAAETCASSCCAK